MVSEGEKIVFQGKFHPNGKVIAKLVCNFHWMGGGGGALRSAFCGRCAKDANLSTNGSFTHPASKVSSQA